MGVKTILRKKDLQPYINCSTLTKTTYGVTDTVYIVDNIYILKLFENISEKTIQNEINLLKLLNNNLVPIIEKDIFYIKKKPALLYKKCDGYILDKSSKNNIKEIGKFLKEFHNITKEKTNSNIKLFDKYRLKYLIEKTNYKIFITIFNTIDIDLKNDGIIHGDLFIDNAIFKNDKLSCVIDFTNACVGDFIFDIAVVAQDWCNNDDDIQILLKSYEIDIKLEKFKEYIKYALLYYSVLRYIDNRDYKTLLERIRCI